MFRTSTMGLAGLAVAVCVALAGSAAAATGGSAATGASAQTDLSWCTRQGGQAVEYSPWYKTNSSRPTRLGGSHPLCVFAAADGTRILVATDTLAADRPTLASLAYTRRPDASEGPTSDVNPATWYCERIGGTAQFGDSPADVGGWAPSDQAAPGDFIGMCVFPDRSMIDAWGLAYHTHSIIRGADLAGKWNATVPQG
jgi:putative hemolysin